MACSDKDKLWEFLASFDGNHPVDAVTCSYTSDMGAGMGMPIFALLVFAGIGLAYAIYHQSVAPLFVAAIFAGPVFMFLIPSGAVRIVVFFAVLAMTVAGYTIYQRAQTSL
ncbi:hypothetical protein M0R89_10510 [Halorussus limi]|uniref:Uncharacterized protein n=1 Tax=Halorussus limi TaxID=2938695 RepID=A0A8U0HPU9_9EURY|nr:hypothetical protein [Halorussus limi]UPV72980.1 hypothetical protein M0R89_10510 [Halorussus limi]